MKQQLIQMIRAKFAEWYPEAIGQPGYCLKWTHAAGLILQENGVKSVPQAGTMLWRFKKKENDDGVSPTHFGFGWSPDNEFSRIAVALGKLPEMHCWLYLPHTEEIVDFSTGTFIEHCFRDIGFIWETDAPPVHLWATLPNLPPDAFYRPNMDAIRFMLTFAAGKMGYAA